MSGLADQFAFQGWGRLSLENLNLEQGLIRVLLKNQPFEICKGPHENPVCFFTKGAIAGILSAIFDKDLRVKEVDCTGKDKGLCRFVYEFDYPFILR